MFFKRHPCAAAYSRRFKKQPGRFDGGVAFIRRNSFALQGYGVRRKYLEFVRKGNILHEHIQLVHSVRTPAGHRKRQVQLCKCFQFHKTPPLNCGRNIIAYMIVSMRGFMLK